MATSTTTPRPYSPPPPLVDRTTARTKKGKEWRKRTSGKEKGPPSWLWHGVPRSLNPALLKAKCSGLIPVLQAIITNISMKPNHGNLSTSHSGVELGTHRCLQRIGRSVNTLPATLFDCITKLQIGCMMTVCNIARYYWNGRSFGENTSHYLGFIWLWYYQVRDGRKDAY